MPLAESLKLLEQYGVVILPALVVAEQIGIPLPAVPALLAVGALAASGRASIPLVLGAIALVALTVDLGWYELGRRRGVGVLARLCRLSLEPDSCVLDERRHGLAADRGRKAAMYTKRRHLGMGAGLGDDELRRRNGRRESTGPACDGDECAGSRQRRPASEIVGFWTMLT